MGTRVSVRSPGVLHQLLAHEQSLRQNLPAKLQALRLQRQWSALRAERELTQLLLALIRVQIQLVQAHASPSSAPARFKTDGGHLTWVATLEHQQLGLRLRASAAARQRESELQCAAALRKRAERRRQLAAVLRRCVPVYQAGPSRLHAPVEVDQAAFERVVCSAHAREGRLIRRWVAHFVSRERSAAPSSGAVVDFVAYVGRLIAAEYSFGAEALPPPLQPRPRPGPLTPALVLSPSPSPCRSCRRCSSSRLGCCCRCCSSASSPSTCRRARTVACGMCMGRGAEGVWRDVHGVCGSEGVWRVRMRVADVPA